MDLVKCTLDYESLDLIPKDKVFSNFRYSTISIYFGDVSRVIKTALRFKNLPVIDPYLMAGLVEV
jgi:hypothetical protein